MSGEDPPQPLLERPLGSKGLYTLVIYPQTETVLGCRRVVWWPVFVVNVQGRCVASAACDGCTVQWFENLLGALSGELVLWLASMNVESWCHDARTEEG